MQALTFHGVEHVAYESVPDPELQEPRDAIVRVEAAGLCGSDLHPYFGRETGIDRGTVLGHEFVGEVVEFDSEAQRRLADAGDPLVVLAPGTRVVAPFTSNCGTCVYCRVGLTARCQRGQLFGWRERGRGLHGGQAQFVRVPFADATLVPVPTQLEDPGLAILAGDILSTALFAVELAAIRDDDVVAVVGCGPVGLLAIRAALRAGARAVIAVDHVESRLAAAERFGAVPAPAPAGEGDPFEALAIVHERTDGVGADAAIEAAGTPRATHTAAALLRAGARLAAVAVHSEPNLGLSPAELYNRNLTYAAGRCPARRLLPSALRFASIEYELLHSLISHRLPLSQGPDAYRRFGAREPGWLKVLLTP
jgi:threonine dehydrogenase-like Zn-dependent dehydrogenase